MQTAIIVLPSNQTSVFCGDIDDSGYIDIYDIFQIGKFLFKDNVTIEPQCLANVIGDDLVDTHDLEYMAYAVFGDGPPPVDSCCSGGVTVADYDCWDFHDYKVEWKQTHIPELKLLAKTLKKEIKHCNQE